MTSSMEVHDTFRYQDAVQRLKRLLNEEPQQADHQYQSTIHNTTSTYSFKSHSADWLGNGTTATGVGGGVGGDPERFSRSKRKSPQDDVGWLLTLLHHQEELITQLEKENDFLKREILSVGEGAKQVAQENQDLSRRLAKSVSEALAQDEELETPSNSEHSQDINATNTSAKLQSVSREKTFLESEVERLQSTLDDMRGREQQALDKLRKALVIAEDTQAFTAQVRATSESAIAELSGLLEAKKEEKQELKRLLEEADSKTNQAKEQQDQWKSQQQQRIKLLEDEIADHTATVNQLEGEVREKGRKITALRDDLQVAQVARTRLEQQLEEQRRHSKESHAKLDHIVTMRNTEISAATSRANDLQDRLTSARQDITRLLETITSMAQGSGRSGNLESTDDNKTEKIAVEQQASVLLSMLQSKHEAEVKSLHDAALQHQQCMEYLKQEIADMKRQMADDSEKHREKAVEAGKVEGLRDELQQAHQQIVREQEQAQIHGAMYQQILEKLKKTGNRLSSVEKQNNDLVDSISQAHQDRNTLLQEISLLRKISASVDQTKSNTIMAAVTSLSGPNESQSSLLAHCPSPQHEQRKNLERDPTKRDLDLLVNDGVFKNVVVAPGVTLLQMYHEKEFI